MLKIIKRDGLKKSFDMKKVETAVVAACEAVYKPSVDKREKQTKLNSELVCKVVNALEDHIVKADKLTIKISTVQKVVENTLMKENGKVARAYIEYRYNRDKIREKQNSLTQAISALVDKSDLDTLNENANKDTRVFPTQRDLLAGLISKHFARNYILPEHVVKGHDEGLIHYHDLDYAPFLPMSNCCLVDLKGMLGNGFKLGNACIESPKSIGVATAVMAQITAQVASHQYGGTTFANVDQVLAPYVKMSYKKNLESAQEWKIPEPEDFAVAKTLKDVYDAFQAYEYEVNSLYTSCGQSPFVTVTFGMGTSWEERSIQEAILKVRIKGLGKDGITPNFPKLVMFMEEGINMKPSDINYDIKQLALECASKRMYPDIISAKINREITGSSVPVSPMGCRSFLSVWHDENGNEVLDGRNNLGVVSLNLPRIALDADGDITKFEEILEQRLELVFDALMTRINQFKGVKASVAPVLYQEGAFGVRMNPTDDVIELFKNGRASISMGYIGIHEVLVHLFGQHPVDSEEVQEYGKEIVRKLKAATVKWKQETGYGFSLYSTPAESLCHRFAKIDKKIYGTVEGVNEFDYYTNSFHQDVFAKTKPLSKVIYEKDYHRIATGGHISYVEYPNMKNNLKGLEAVWDYAMQHVAYFGTNTPVDQCFDCGAQEEMTPTSDGFVCPVCGNNHPDRMQVTRRTCGYLGSAGQVPWNSGKYAEMQNRYKHFTSQAL